ncbi:MAG: sigma 54-interacting transcriptional regulator, partial [Myxococcota bacterium]
AEVARARAARAGDARTKLFAWWAIADASPAGRVTLPSFPFEEQPTDRADDAQQLAARRLRHGADLDLDRWDAAAATVALPARLAWWGARAERKAAPHPHRVLAALVALADARGLPRPTVGRAMAAGAALAAAQGAPDALERLETAREQAAAPVRRATASGPLEAAARSCSWLRPRPRAGASSPDQVIDLQALVRALSERNQLSALLDRTLDVLLLWTQAERGLLLMPGADDELRVEAARNVGREELAPEQLEVSTSLARQARVRGEPVVAVDAMAELPHQSVHALRLRSVLALPLLARGDVVGVAYLDDRARRGAFGEREVQRAQAIAPVAALAILDARTQARLAAAVDRAEGAQRQLEDALARKQSALDLAERELAAVVRGTSSRPQFEGIIGESDVMQDMLRMVDRVASSDVPVLLRGASGSGKELVARALHRCSPRADHAFVGEHCGALPESLLASTLFGHVKGAFTGAHRPRIGLFEAAHRGTLFLDEIGEMSLGMQTKLLRVLEERRVRPVGANDARDVDVRIVGATHRDLEAMVADGSFREDLYYRLNVITIRIPALRDRAGDIPLLVAHLVAKHAAGRSVRVSEAAMARLMAFPWPGNVRQLENEVRRALLLADDHIEITHLSLPAASDHPTTGRHGPASPRDGRGLTLRTQLDRLESKLVREALAETEGNQTRAAKLLGVSRYGLHKMIRRLEIEVPSR